MTEITLQWTNYTNKKIEQVFHIHPKAARFARRPPERFQELCEHIKGTKQERPIRGYYTDEKIFIVVDGHDRLHACKELGIEPLLEVMRDHSDAAIDALIYSENVIHKQLSKGAYAMAVVMFGPNGATSRPRGGDHVSPASKQKAKEQTAMVADCSEDGPVSERYSRMARFVYREAENEAVVAELADATVRETRTLEEAYNITRQIKQEREKRIADEAARAKQLEELRRESPQLAALVDEERMTLTAAIGANEALKVEQTKREEEEAKQRENEEQRIKQEQVKKEAEEQRAHDDRMQRYLLSVKPALNSLASLVNLAHDANRDDVLEAMGDFDRGRFEAYEEEFQFKERDMQRIINIGRGKHGENT